MGGMFRPNCSWCHSSTYVIGLSASRSHYRRGVESDQEGWPPEQGKGRVCSTLWGKDLCAALPQSLDEATESRYDAMHPGPHHRCTTWWSIYSSTQVCAWLRCGLLKIMKSAFRFSWKLAKPIKNFLTLLSSSTFHHSFHTFRSNRAQGFGCTRRVCSTKGRSNSDGSVDVWFLFNALCSLTLRVRAEPGSLPSRQIKPFLTVLSSFIQGQSSNKRDIAVQCLESLLSRRDCRQEVWRIPGIITGCVFRMSSQLPDSHPMLSFVGILGQHPGPQMSYQVAFCIWLLSFEQNIAEQINRYVTGIFVLAVIDFLVGNTTSFQAWWK